MSQMIYRPGNSAKWKGIGYDWRIISAEDAHAYIDEGWVDHPDKLMTRKEENEEKPKRGRKPKAVTDESND